MKFEDVTIFSVVETPLNLKRIPLKRKTVKKIEKAEKVEKAAKIANEANIAAINRKILSCHH